MSTSIFKDDWYQAHNAVRQAHLASLGLPLERRRVLELGAGVGDHTEFFLSRGCEVTVTDGREENVAVIRARYPHLDVRVLDVENPGDFSECFAVVYCYGLLYHLEDPLRSLEAISRWCGDLFLLETCVSTGSSAEPKYEDTDCTGNALRGVGCYPERTRVREAMQRLFPHVYVPITHPMGAAFCVPLDWVDPRGECRAVFIGANYRLPQTDKLTHFRGI